MSDFFGKILVVDDDLTLRRLLETTLEASGFHCDSVASLSAMRKVVQERTYDAVLLDLIFDDEDGLSAIPFLVQNAPGTKIIMMSAHGTIEVAVTAMEKGATAFISKSKDTKNIIAELKRRLTPSLVEIPSDAFAIIGISIAVTGIIAQLRQIRDVDANVLIAGETGTGKNLLARTIHRSSSRSANRFEAINCKTISENNIESELFGHKKGAFPGARNGRKGILEICTGGTLVLDAVGGLPIAIQNRLFPALQEKTITPVGSKEAVSFNTRIIATTDNTLSPVDNTFPFNPDLFQQLSVIKVDLPPLRERVEDISLLVNHFLKEFNQKFSKSVLPASLALQARLNSYNWPGNIRELRDAVERGVVLSQDGTLKLENMLDIAEDSKIAQDSTFDKTLSEAKQDFERKYLQHLLETTRGNISEMARISGRYRTDIYRLLAKHGVDWEEFRPDQ